MVFRVGPYDMYVVEYIQHYWGRTRQAVARNLLHRFERWTGRKLTQTYQYRADGSREILHEQMDARWTEPYGDALAAAVADRLRRGTDLAYRHRDYCGIGVFKSAGRVDVAQTHDGYAGDAALSFEDCAAFALWLSEQSDCSMSGRHKDAPLYVADQFYQDNQRITRARLEAFVMGSNG